MIKGVVSTQNTILEADSFDLSHLADFLEQFGAALLILTLVLIAVFIFVFCVLVKFAYHLCDIFFTTLYKIFHDFVSKGKQPSLSGNSEPPTEEGKSYNAFQYFIENGDKVLGQPSNPVKNFILRLLLGLLKFLFKRGDSSSVSEKKDEQ